MFPPVVVLVRTRRDLRDALAELRWAGLVSLPRSLAADNVLDDPIAAVPPPSEQAEERPAVRPASDEKPTSAPPGLPGRLVPLWPDAGEALGYRSRSATYDAASKGFIQTVTLGRKLKKVSTVWLNQVLAGGLNTVLARINTARPIRPETESGPPRTGRPPVPSLPHRGLNPDASSADPAKDPSRCSFAPNRLSVKLRRARRSTKRGGGREQRAPITHHQRQRHQVRQLARPNRHQSSPACAY